VRSSYGRFLLERGRVDEALVQLAAASEHEPRDDEDLGARVRLRGDHAAALLAAGKPEEARERFSRALSGDLDDTVGRAQYAVAGIAASALVLGLPPDGNGASPAAPTSATAEAEFELLHTSGLYALERRQWREARTAPRARAQGRPVPHLPPARRAVRPRRANRETRRTPSPSCRRRSPRTRSTCGTLFQRGRLLLENGDPVGAEESFRAALDRELDHTPTLEQLGALRFERGDQESAALYFDRALALEPTRGVVWSRRGFNH
jgi:Tfp pilus assembly protein PilF